MSSAGSQAPLGPLPRGGSGVWAAGDLAVQLLPKGLSLALEAGPGPTPCYVLCSSSFFFF